MLVKEILRKKDSALYSVDPDHTVYQAIEGMSEHNVGALLVLENEKLVGIITERDYRTKVILKGKTSKETKVRDIMTQDVIAVKPEATVKMCMQLMTEKHIRHLPVLDGEVLVGIISIGDVVKSVINNQKIEIESLRDYIASGYPH